MKLTTNINDIDRQQWADLIAKSKDGSFYQSEAFYRLAEASAGFKPYLTHVYDDDKLVGSLLSVKIKESNGIKGAFSARTVVYAGPIISETCENKETTLSALLLALNASQKSSIFIQFRNFFDLSEYQEVFEKHGFSFRERLNFLVKLDSMEAVWSRMSVNRRRKIKTSLMPDTGYRMPVPSEVEESDTSKNEKRKTKNEISAFCDLRSAIDVNEVRQFYEILYSLYKTRVKKPLPAWSFFESFFEMTQKKPESGIILLVIHNDKIIGGILCPVSPGKTIYEWYVCGLDEEHKELSPSTLATWAAMDYGLKNNIPQFDFMGVGLPNKPYGVREFKRRFGGELVNYGRYSRINNKLLYFIAEVGYNLLALVNKI